MPKHSLLVGLQQQQQQIKLVPKANSRLPRLTTVDELSRLPEGNTS
jgi:hypothetical protein